MFGYVRPRREELKVWELAAYEGAYCGLCRAMGRRHGFWARLLLSYDVTFLAVLLTPSPERPVLEQRPCPARLWCRRKGCCIQSPGLDAAADAGAILGWWRLRDILTDSPFWRRQGARLFSLLLKPGYRRAAAARADFDALAARRLKELGELERAGTPSLDRPADAFAQLLRAAAPPSGDPNRDRALGELLYHTGRWIYLLDAWDDLEEDRAAGTYNPIAARYPDGPAAHRDEIRLTLAHSRNRAAAACALLEHGTWRGVVENIVYLGLPTVEELVFSGRWRAVKGRVRTI